MDVATILAWLSVVAIILGFLKIIKDHERDKTNKERDIKNLNADIANITLEIRDEISNREKAIEDMCVLIDKVVQKMDVVALRLADISVIDGNQKSAERRLTQFEQMQERLNDKFDGLTATVNKIWVSLEGKANRENSR
jgi:hypothetical protein